jgi:hypothetical protein
MFIKYIATNILFLSCVCTFLCAQENVSISLSKKKVFVGDKINFIVKVQLPQNAQINATQNFSFNDFDIVSSDIKHISVAENIYELNFNIAVYKTGTLKINPFSVLYINSDGTDNSFFTPEAQIEVESIIESGAIQDIKDIKPVKKLKIKTIYIFLISLISILFTICIISIAKTIIKQIEKSKQIEIDPKTKALNTLSNLYKDRNNIGTRLFYYKMSEILRTYVSRQYRFDAMEMTTSEFFDKVKTFLPQEININEFKNYLKIFNLARYADFKPNEIETENNYNFTKKLLELL